MNSEKECCISLVIKEIQMKRRCRFSFIRLMKRKRHGWEWMVGGNPAVDLAVGKQLLSYTAGRSENWFSFWDPNLVI